ncbi:nitrogen permease regulator of amino acid transport activity 3-domain-containing protein [Phycomyces blakesleeanus]|uniref:Nitrogen permease regulator 3 n=1 Tax=Phycomyces blakesleeanus TaxID=4837 RepID=A0ABR3B5R4_PHYBL
MTLFHVVFVLSPPDLELNSQVEAIYDHVVLRYTSALRYEQLRCGYVQEEIDKVLSLKEDALNKGTPYDQVTQDILRVSSLAQDMRQMYLAISTNTAAHLIINDFIDLSLQIPLLGANVVGAGGSGGGSGSSGHASWLMDIYGVGGYVYDTYPVLCPYHTLLLLEDPEEVLKNMPLDASPTLVQLVQILTPTQSLQELHLLLDCSLAQIIPALDRDFRLHIPNLDFPTLLSQLSIAKPLYKIAPSKEFRNQYLEAITYLVRKDLVVQLHMFLVLVLPFGLRPSLGDSENEDESKKQLSSANASAATVSASAADMAASPGELEWKALKRLAHEKAPKEIADLFERLVPYMDGKHPIEEIMYREGVSRRQLSLVLKYYRDNIVTIHHY